MTVVKPTTASATIQINCEVAFLFCRRSVSHHVNAKRHENGTNVSFANAPNNPQTGSKYHFRLMRLQVTAARKHASPLSTKPTSCKLGTLKLSRKSAAPKNE